MLSLVVFGTPPAVTLSTPRPSAVARRPGRHDPAAVRLPIPAADDLYARRMRRRFASYLRLRLLELREERLDRAADAIARRIPISELLQDR